MKKNMVLLLLAVVVIAVFFTGCTNKEVYSGKEAVLSSGSSTDQAAAGDSSQSVGASHGTDIAEKTNVAEKTAQTEIEVIDYNKVKPNESGQVMVVMFHNFVAAYPKGTNEYTTTFSEFEKLLQELYDSKYRLVNLNDMLNNEIDVPAGCIPMVFTFDDGTAGQFNLIEKDGKLVANPESAVGIMEAFNEKHPDFGLRGTFFVNLGVSTFKGEGTVAERLDYLIEKGFEIGNHTKTHVSLPDVKTVDKMLEEVGGNQKLMEEYVSGYKFNSFSLPYGNAAKDLQEYVVKGNYQGTEYNHSAIMLVGANPSPSPVSTKFNPVAVPRVRSTGMKKVQCDLAWWLEEVKKGDSQYISDGNKDTVTVPKSKQENVDMSKLHGKQLITY